MTEKFEAELSQQMHSYIASLEDAIINGGATKNVDASQPQIKRIDRPGLKVALPVVCDRLKDAYRERFYQQIVVNQGAKP